MTDDNVAKINSGYIAMPVQAIEWIFYSLRMLKGVALPVQNS